MIPQIMMFYINPNTRNIIQNYLSDDSYFKTKNNFKLNSLRIGPFTTPKMLKLQFSTLVQKDLEFPNREIQIHKESEDRFFFVFKFNSENFVNFDICVKVREAGIKFHFWVNLWYSCLELISNFIFRKKLFLNTEFDDNCNEDNSSWKNNKKEPSNFVEMKNLFYNSEDKVVEDEEEILEDLKEIVFKSRFGSLQSSQLNNSKEFLKSQTLELQFRRRRIASSDRCQSVLQLIDDLSIDPDLNVFISGLNEKASNRNRGVFNKENLSISLGVDELDKFKKGKEMLSGFAVVLNFSLKV